MEDLVFRQRLRTMQIIAAALIIGALALVGGMVGVKTNIQPPAAGAAGQMVSLVSLFFLPGVLLAVLVLPGFVEGQMLRQLAQGKWQPPPGANPQDFQGDLPKLLALRQTLTIIVLALLESAVTMGAVAYFIEGQPWVLGVSAVAVLIMAVNFPRPEAVHTWLQRRLERLEDLRRQET